MSILDEFKKLQRTTDKQKRCPKCGEMHSRMRDHAKGLLASTCRKCHAEYCRPRRARYKDLSQEQKLKANCRSYAKTYLRRGKIQRAPCRICGEPKAQMHHEDYTKPLQVIWLCHLCHTRYHWLRGDLVGEYRQS